MKSNNRHTGKKSLRNAIARFAFCGLLGATCAVSLADNGRGSIRGSNRGGPPRRAPAPPQRQSPRQEPPPRQQPGHPGPDDHRDDQHNGGRPDDHRDGGRPDDHDHGPPPPPPDHRGGWDDHDDDRDHMGGYGRGSPARFERGQRFHDIVRPHVAIVFGGINYFYGDDGSFYQPQPDGQYLCIQPPVGALLPYIPSGCVPITFGGATYYYIDGVFFQQQDAGYLVVNPPPWIVVPDVPSGATQLIFKNVIFYQFNGYNYAPAIQDGVTVYTVTPIS